MMEIRTAMSRKVSQSTLLIGTKVSLFSLIHIKSLICIYFISLVEQSSIHIWCHVLHGFLVALHMILILLLIHHPEHKVTMSVYNTWVTTMLAICLQAFYVVSLLLYCSFTT